MQSEAVLERQLLLRRESPVWPFAWRGLLPTAALALTMLFAVGPVARNWIQGTVERETRAQLDAAGFHWVTLAVSGQRVTLSGEAPSAAAGEQALAAARAATCPTWTGRRTCAASVAANFTVAPPLPAALPAAAAAETCQRSLASVLAGEQIRFARDSAVIGTRSGRLLDRLADEARGCRGVIRIEGYTDSAGRPAANRALSRARAAAVRDALIARGIPAERLEARGFGSARPIVSNHTAKGRARNRRIEFHAVAAGRR
jgi:outer membrane protein OmpA-like peptidoglycan-associated protein